MNTIIISSVIMLLLDFIWIGTYMGPQYKPMIQRIQGSPMETKYIFAIFVYLLMILGLNLFVLPNISKNNLFYDSLKYGFLFGIILFGVYDFTIGALLKKWDIKLAFIDVLWGGILYFLTSYLTIKIQNILV
tara:strand:+ start:145 stop:540 length:396 start_codon:yes stop_codon:yes gene_type:complete